jgi:hypothetical protein
MKKKFWKELIAHFIWYVSDRIETHASNHSSIVAFVFFAAGMRLLSYCLATESFPSNNKGHTQTRKEIG